MSDLVEVLDEENNTMRVQTTMGPVFMTTVARGYAHIMVRYECKGVPEGELSLYQASVMLGADEVRALREMCDRTLAGFTEGDDE